MAILEVLRFPDERLRTVARNVVSFDSTVQQIIDDMFETMYAEEGIGLAATQVNIHQRIIVIDTSEDRTGQLVLINPEMLEQRGSTGIEEGKIRAMNPQGEQFELETDGLLAICIQHEMDHLVGKLFVDYLSPLKRQRIRQKMLKMDKLDRRPL